MFYTIPSTSHELHPDWADWAGEPIAFFIASELFPSKFARNVNIPISSDYVSVCSTVGYIKS